MPKRKNPTSLPSKANCPPCINVHQQFIQETATKFAAVGVPPHVFQPSTYLKHGFTEPHLAFLLLPFWNSHDTLKLKRVLTIGFRYCHFDITSPITAPQFYTFLRFINEPFGRNVFKLTMLREGFMDMGDKSTSSDLHLISLFESQRHQYLNCASLLRHHHEKIIGDLERQLHQARLTMKRELEQCKQEYMPASCYEGFSAEEFWRSWSDHVLKFSVPFNGLNLHQAVGAFNELMHARAILACLNHGGNKQLLSDFVQRRKVEMSDKAADVSSTKPQCLGTNACSSSREGELVKQKHFTELVKGKCSKKTKGSEKGIKTKKGASEMKTLVGNA